MQAKDEINRQALSNARFNKSLSNYPAIYNGFIEKGISEKDIEPRVNIFTYNAWLALGRRVKKGEHGVKVVTVIKGSKPATDGNKDSKYSYPKTTTVFHISQTEAV